MQLQNAVEWTKRALSRIGLRDGERVPVHTRDSGDMLAVNRASAPAVDIFESEHDYQILIDAPGASAGTTHVTWDDIDTLSVHVRRNALTAGVPWVREYEESDWFRQVRLSPDVDGTKVTCTAKDGVVRVILPLLRTRTVTSIPILATDIAS